MPAWALGAAGGSFEENKALPKGKGQILSLGVTGTVVGLTDTAGKAKPCAHPQTPWAFVEDPSLVVQSQRGPPTRPPLPSCRCGDRPAAISPPCPAAGEETRPPRAPPVSRPCLSEAGGGLPVTCCWAPWGAGSTVPVPTDNGVFIFPLPAWKMEARGGAWGWGRHRGWERVLRDGEEEQGGQGECL